MGKGVSWDGKSYLDYRTTDYDYKDSFEHETGGGMSRFDHAGYAEDMAYGTGSRKNFLKPLYDAGIPEDQFDYYAKQAGISNVNSKGDLEDIISFYNKDERYQGDDDDGDEKKKKKKEKKFKEPEVSEERQEEWDNKEALLDAVDQSRAAALQRSLTPVNRYGDYGNYDRFSDRDSFDMRDKDKDEESQDFANKYKLGVLASALKSKEA